MEGIQLEIINIEDFCTIKSKETKILKLKYQKLCIPGRVTQTFIHNEIFQTEKNRVI